MLLSSTLLSTHTDTGNEANAVCGGSRAGVCCENDKTCVLLFFLLVRKLSGLLVTRRDTVQGRVKVSLCGSQISAGFANIVL
jgi:hypothetical protein